MTTVAQRPWFVKLGKTYWRGWEFGYQWNGWTRHWAFGIDVDISPYFGCTLSVGPLDVYADRRLPGEHR